MITSYPPGIRVEIRNEEWMVRRTDDAGGARAVHVVGLSELVRHQEAIFLDDLDPVRVLAPDKTELVPDDSPGHRRTRLYLEALLRRSPPTDPRLVIGHRAAISPTPYQWEPAALALSQPQPRILMADGVGLGKTIEVGVLLSELIQRGRGRRILVVALKSVLKQLQEEFWARFTLPLVRLDSVGIQRVQARIPSNQNPFHVFDRVIVSIDTLKKDARYRRYLEDCRWDAVVIDECQNVAERGVRSSQRARLARLLARNTDALILTSATPHDGRPQSFASLMRLLDPTAIADDTDYQRDEVEHLFKRRFQKDVRDSAVGQFHERQVRILRPDCTPAEEQVLRALHDARFQTVGKKRNNDALFRWLLYKAWLSSPQACSETLAERAKRLRARTQQTPKVAHDLDLLQRLGKQVSAVKPAHTSKLQALFDHLAELGWTPGRPGQRIVIFSERIPTLHMLEAELRRRFKLKDQLAVFHGGLADRDQYAMVQDFTNANGSLRILLGSDAASAGLNLHHACHHLVHYDIPWSLITLEQRNGRIDRFGQQHPPQIRYLVSEPADPALKGDQHILERLIQKEDEASKNLGDVAWLMQLHQAEKEQQRILEGLADGVPADELIPELDDAAGDWLQELLGAGVQEPVETAQPFRLFDQELAYAREAFTELALDGEAQAVEWFPELSGFRLRAPEDLNARYQLMPPELRTERGEFRLSTDRDFVMREYARARDQDAGWPEWELFWEQHPIAEWLNDRVLAAFRRHEAPLIRVDRGLAPGQSAFLLQGTLSNERSQPVRIVWTAMLRDAKGTLVDQDLAELVQRVGLSSPLPNTGHELNAPALQAALPQVVRAFEDRLRREIRDYEHAAALANRPHVRKLRRWSSKRRDLLQKRQQELLAQPGPKQREVERQLRELDTLFARRKEWIERSVRCVPAPYVRVAAVLSRPE